MKQEKVILHLDMDAFFASCEQANNPSLKNKPVLVSRYDEKSIITAASYESRVFGVKAGMPVFKAKQLLKGVDFEITANGYDLYESYSKTIFNLIKENFTHKVEVVGLDECFIDATNIWSKYTSIKNLCLAIQAAIYQKTTMTCSLGASFNKMFAKMGSDMKKPNGIQIITKQNFKTLIWNLPIENVIGVGKSFKKIAEQLNIKTVNDFVKLSKNEVSEIFGRSGFKMQQTLLGEQKSVVDYTSDEIKSISKEKTILLKNRLTINDPEIKQLLLELTKAVVFRLQEGEVKAKTIQLSIKFFEKVEIAKNRKTFSQTLENYTDDFEIIYSILESKLNEINKNEYVSLIGAGVSNIMNNKKIVTQSKIIF